MDEAIGGASASARWGVRAELRLRLGLCLLSSHERRRRPHRLPSIRALADSAGVHRNTAAAVYRDLERFGLVRCIRGKGTFATAPCDWRQLLTEPLQMAADLGDVVLTELERELHRCPQPVRRFRRESIGPGVLLLPFDMTPPKDTRVFPLAPRGMALAAMSRLRPGSNVRLVSRSPSVARLVRHTLLALHGNTVGMGRVEGFSPGPPEGPDPSNRGSRPDAVARTSSRVVWDLTLVDAHLAAAIVTDRGTSGRGEAFLPLRMLSSGDHRGG